MHAQLEQSPRSVAQRYGVQLAIRLSNSEPGRFARFDLVEDTVVYMLQGGGDDPGISIAVLADDIDAGFQAGLLRGGQERRRLGSKLLVRSVQRIEQQQIPEMKNPGFDP